MIRSFYTKFKRAFRCTGYAVAKLPVRLRRVFFHAYEGLSRFRKAPAFRKRSNIGFWWVELAFYLLDLFALPQLYETWMDFFKWNTRPLSPVETAIARSVFGNSLDYSKILLDERAKVACQKHHILYVSFYTVNSWGAFQRPILIHELVHVWQYDKMGAVYIPRALHAQFTKEGYNYGGVPALTKVMKTGGSLLDFNLEQQADIVSDYYRIREGMRPEWGSGSEEDLPVYEYFIHEIRSNGSKS